MGRRSESDDALHQLEARYADAYAYDIAQVHAYRRDAEGAFHWLDRAHKQRDSLITSLKFDSVLRSLHGDPRYKALLRKMNLPE
jgi:hypothetical protein